MNCLPLVRAGRRWLAIGILQEHTIAGMNLIIGRGFAFADNVVMFDRQGLEAAVVPGRGPSDPNGHILGDRRVCLGQCVEYRLIAGNWESMDVIYFVFS